MPWPDFTELSFGWAYLAEFEKAHVPGGRFPKAPEFISQGEEATKGYDAKVTLSDSTPVFLQLKRSFVLTTKRAREIKDGSYPEPRVYRMNLHKKNKYQQHKALQVLEAQGNQVLYVTSQIYNSQEFARAYASGEIVSKAAALFTPNEIVLPDDVDTHHVSFKAEDNFGYIYSDEPVKFDRKLPFADMRRPFIEQGSRNLDENIAALSEVVDYLRGLGPSFDALRFFRGSRVRRLTELLEGRPVEQQASILAYFLLDAHLTFVKPDKED